MLKRTAHAAIAIALAAGAVTTAATTANAAATHHGEAPSVRTGKGTVRGTVTDTVRTFQGIPYAAPPKGERRWAPPAPARGWQGVRDATEPGDACPQTGIDPPAGRFSSNEDCLFVNVTTPRAGSARPRPVMVYLHGGSHTDGEGAMHGAKRLAAQGDVIVVTVNYRLGTLGYLAHPDLEKGGRRGESGNYGLLDQQAALRWVQRNATAFGGDPDNVTLFGESAGAYSTCAHMVAPSPAGLFHRVILQSGSCTSQDQRHRAGALRQGKETVAALEDGDVDDWRTASPEQMVKPHGQGPLSGPVYGGRLLPRTPQEAFATGEFNKAPVLQGINQDEGRVIAYGMERGKREATGDPNARIEEADYHAFLEGEFGKERAAVIAERYPVDAYDDTPALALAAALTDGTWARSAVGTGRALASQVPTYTFEFADREVPWYADEEEYPKPSFPVGAAHTFELPYLFELTEHQPLTTAQRGLSDSMIRIWTDFARTGKAEWKPTTPTAPNVQSLASGPDGSHPVDFAENHRYDFWKSLD